MHNDRDFYEGQPRPPMPTMSPAHALLEASELRVVRDPDSRVVDLQRRVNGRWVVWQQWEER